GAVPQPGLAGMLGAVDTAEDPAVRLDPMADHAAAAVLALGSERVDRALEAVEDVRGALFHHLEALVIVVAAHFASRHSAPPSAAEVRRPLPPATLQRVCRYP